MSVCMRSISSCHLPLTIMSCRPGRLEVQVEISLPDENGRLQILQIHTNKMKENSFLAPDINLQELGMYLVMHNLFTHTYKSAIINKVIKILDDYGS